MLRKRHVSQANRFCQNFHNVRMAPGERFEERRLAGTDVALDDDCVGPLLAAVAAAHAGRKLAGSVQASVLSAALENAR